MKYKKVVFTKLSPDESRENRHFFDKKVKKAFVQFLAYRGDFDGVLGDEEIELAKQGRLPKDLDIHHIVPLSGTQDPKVNNFDNLTVLHKSTHIKINRKIFDPQLRGIEIGESREIYIPIFKQVDAGRIIAIRSGKMKRKWIPIKIPPANMKKYQNKR